MVAFLSSVVHFLYWIALPRMYETMDMSQAYPIARGVSPILIAMVAFIVLGEDLSTTGVIGILVYLLRQRAFY